MDVDPKNSISTATDNYSSSATDVSDLQREKAQVELQMLRLKSNINAIEFQLNHNERVSPIFIFLEDFSIQIFFHQTNNNNDCIKFNEIPKNSYKVLYC